MAGLIDPVESPQRSPAAMTPIEVWSSLPPRAIARACCAVAVALRSEPASMRGAPNSRAINDSAEPFGDGNTMREPDCDVSKSVGDNE